MLGVLLGTSVKVTNDQLFWANQDIDTDTAGILADQHSMDKARNSEKFIF